MGSPIPQLGAMPIHWIWSLQVLSPLCWLFRLMSSPMGPGNLLLPWHLGLSSGYPQFPIPHCLIFLFNFLSLPIPDPAPSLPPPSLTLPGLSLPLPPMIILVPLLSRTEASTLWSSCFLNFIWSVSCMWVF
ncbi:mCG148045 [Mus musculus]|nr:mCG148045 [Mus musculus]